VDGTAADDMAVAGLSSTSGAHWANRDNETLYRKTGGSRTPFRRPPALNSFTDDERRDDERRDEGRRDDGRHDQGRRDDRREDRERRDGRRPDREELSPSPYLAEDSPEIPATSWFADADPVRRHQGNENAPRHQEPAGYSTSESVRYPEQNQDAVPYPERADAPESEPEPYTRDFEPPAGEPIEPEFGPAPPATPGRVSFGVSAGPISPMHWSGPEPTAPAPAHQEFPDSGHEIRPHRATRGMTEPTPPRGTPRIAEEPRRRSRAMVVSTALLSTLVLLGAAVAGVAYFSGSDKSLRSVLKLAAGKHDDQTASAPLDGRTAAQFELVAATSKATIRTADIGDDLYRISAPDDSAVKPSPVLAKNRVQLHLTPDGGQADNNVDVVLSSKVRWSLRFTGGADEQIVDLTKGQISGLDVLGGIRRFELKLPKPTGTVPVRVTGAIEDFSIQSPVGNPVRVQVDSGAKTVAAGEITLKNVKPGSTLTPKDWKVANRYDVDAAARVTLLSVGNAG
jgi:hypothetical protein